MNVYVTVPVFVFFFHMHSTAPYDLGRRVSNLGEDAVWSQSSSSLLPYFFLPLAPLGAGRGSYSFTAIIINIQLIQEVGRTKLDAVKSSAYSKQQP